ncbi:MAG: cytochrome c, partial [Gemmatimonadaceae bacterium]
MTRDRIVKRRMSITPSAALLLLSFNACSFRDTGSISTDSAVIAKGEVTFVRNCSGCHNFRQDGIGPHLGGLTAQVSPDWIERFIRDRSTLIESGDQRAQRLSGKYKVAMPSFTSFTDDEIAGIMAYMNTQKAPDRRTEQSDAKEVLNPIRDTIGLSNLVVGLQLVAQIPSSSPRGVLPRTRITKLDFEPHSGRSFVLDLRGKLYELRGKTPVVYMDMTKLKPRFIHEPGLATGFGSFAFHPDFAN